MLGRAFAIQTARYIPGARILNLDKSRLDVCNPKGFSVLGEAAPDYIVHCAALVDADYCEKNPVVARNSIIGGTQNVIEYTVRSGAKLLYPQSFLIHSDTGREIDESTVAHPISVYGQLKLEAERLIQRDLNDALIICMGGFFGGEAGDKNFVGRMTPHLAGLISKGENSIGVGDRVWQPTYTHDLAANCLLLFAKECSGKYCMASQDFASFYDIVVEITNQLGIGDQMRIERLDAAILATKEKAKRPQSLIMHNVRLQAEGLDRQRRLRESLAEYLYQPYFKEMFQ